MASQSIPCGFHDCDETFATDQDRKIHLKDAHDGKLPCGFPGCEMTAKMPNQLTRHKKKFEHWTTDDKQFPCTTEACTNVYHTEFELLAHQKDAHSHLFPHVCQEPKCGARFKSLYTLNQHTRDSHGEHQQFPCIYTKCAVKIQFKGLQTHIKHIHREKKHPCDAEGCSCLFDNEQDLVDHQTAHESDTPYLCNERDCSESYAIVQDLILHECNEHSRSLCDICNKTFPSPLAALLHANDEHKPPACSKCLHFKKSGPYTGLLRHLESHEEGELGSVQITRNPRSTTGSLVGASSWSLAQDDPKSQAAPTGRAASRGQAASKGRAASRLAVQQTSAQHSSPEPEPSARARAQTQQVVAFTSQSSGDGHSASLLSDTSLEEQFIAGARLQRFKQLLLARPAITWDKGVPIRELLAGPELQHVNFEVVATADTTYLRFSDVAAANNAPLLFDIKHLNLDTASQRALGVNLQEMLKRIPQSIFELPSKRLAWLLQAGLVSTAQALSSFRPRLTLPVAFHSKKYPHYELIIRGYDPTTGASWEMRRRFGKLFNVQTDLSEIEGFDWYPETSTDSSDQAPSKTDVNGLELALSGAKLVYCRFNGWIGTKDDCSRAISAFLGQNPVKPRDGGIAANKRVGMALRHATTISPGTRILGPGSWQVALRLPRRLVISLPTTDATNVPCDTFADSDVHDFSVCSHCITSGDTASNATRDPLSGLRRGLRGRILFDCKASGEVLNDEEVSLRFDQIWEQLKAFIGDDGSVHDSLIEQVLCIDFETTKESWSGKRFHPKRPSIDAFFPVVETSTGSTGYHLPGNVSILADSVNRLMRHYPKFLLYPIRKMILAKDQETYNDGLAVFIDAHINTHEMRPFSQPHQTERLGLSLPENWEDIKEALRTGRLLKRTVPKARIWRVSEQFETSKEPPSDWNFPDLDYIKAQLHLAAQTYGLDTQDLQQCWLRDGVFFPFAMSSITLRWTWFDCYRFFAAKLKRMRNECDHLYKDDPNRPDCSVGELMIMVAHLWMRNVQRDHFEKKLPLELCGRDELGLVPYPTIGWLLSSSLGHLHHGRQMATGVSGYDPWAKSNCSFDPEICNICWETQACNGFKFAYHEDYYEEMFAQVLNLRVTPVENAQVSLPPPEAIHSVLRDEVNVVDPKGSEDVARAMEAAEDELWQDTTADDPDTTFDDDEEEDFELRCFCGKDASDSADPDELIKCTLCGTWQHKECMEAEDLQPQLYTCELCSPGKAITPAKEQIERIIPKMARPALSERNMGRTVMSCYISAPVQLALKLPEVADMLQQRFSLLITGRDPSELNRWDASPGKDKVSTFFARLQSVHKALRTAGPKTDMMLTKALMESSYALYDHWDDLPHDAVEYWNFLLNVLSTISDTSSHAGIKEKQTAQQRFEHALEDRIENKSMDTLQADSIDAISSWKESGHDNDIAKAFTVHIVKEAECAACHAINREFQHDSVLRVTIPEDLEDGKVFSLYDAAESFFANRRPSQELCKCCSNSITADNAAVFTTTGARIINAPELLAFEINRLHSETNPDGSFRNFQKDNRVLEDDSFDLATFQSRLPLPSMEEPHLSGSTKYRRVGVLGYFGGFIHWVAAVRGERDNTGNWIYYDDTMDRPRFLAPDHLPPDQDTGAAFTEGLIIYRKEVEPQSPVPAVEDIEIDDPIDFAIDDAAQTADEGAVEGLEFADTFGLFGDDAAQGPQEGAAGGNVTGQHAADLQGLQVDTLVAATTDDAASKKIRSKLEADIKAFESKKNSFEQERLRLLQENGRLRQTHLKAEKVCSFFAATTGDPDTPVLLEHVTDYIEEMHAVNADVARLLDLQGIQHPEWLLSKTVLSEVLDQQTSSRSRQSIIELVDSLRLQLSHADQLSLLRAILADLPRDTSPRAILDIVYTHVVRGRIMQQQSPAQLLDLVHQAIIMPMASTWQHSATSFPERLASSPPSFGLGHDHQPPSRLPSEPLDSSPPSVVPGHNYRPPSSVQPPNPLGASFSNYPAGLDPFTADDSTPQPQTRHGLVTPTRPRSTVLTGTEAGVKSISGSGDEDDDADLLEEPLASRSRRKGSETLKRVITERGSFGSGSPGPPKKRPSLTGLRGKFTEAETEAPLLKSPPPHVPTVRSSSLGLSSTLQSLQGYNKNGQTGTSLYGITPSNITSPPGQQPTEARENPSETVDTSSTKTAKAPGLTRSGSVRSMRSTYGSPTKSSIAKSRTKATAESLFSPRGHGSNNPAELRSPTKHPGEARSLTGVLKRQLGKGVRWATGTTKDNERLEQSDDESDKSDDGDYEDP